MTRYPNRDIVGSNHYTFDFCEMRPSCGTGSVFLRATREKPDYRNRDNDGEYAGTVYKLSG